MTQPGSAPTPNPPAGLRRLVAVTLAVVFGYLLVSAREPFRLNWGDSWSDANVLTALNYSSRYGFIATSFTDILDVGPLTAESYRYTHYPPFAEIFYGCVRKLAGGKPLDISVYRVLAIGFAGIGLFGFFRWCRALWGSALAHWAAALCATNLLWLEFADSIHQSPILFAAGMTALAASAGAGRPRFFLIAIGTYVCFLTAYDYYIFLPTAALLTSRALGVPLLSKRMAALAGCIAGAGTLAIATKAIFVSGALGWTGFLEDVHFQFLERATTQFSPDYRAGFVIILLTRWTSYFTPVLLAAPFVLLGLLGKGLRKSGARAALRSFFRGDERLTEHPASALIPFASGLPFVLLFSQLAVEQVLPSQVMVPFYAVATGWLLRWLGRSRPELAYAAFGVVVAWQGAHLARVPKAFLERDTIARVEEYLRDNDTADFVVTNLLSDGPIQYFFDRHLHMPETIAPRAPDFYEELASRTPSTVIHALYFEDPNGRFVDKALWSILPQQHRWATLGSPYLFRQETLDAIRAWDGRVLEGLQRSGKEVLRLPGARIFRLTSDVEARRRARVPLLTEPTRAIDFGTTEADAHKLSGFRFAENYPNVPGFCWSVGRAPQRSILTKRGLIFRHAPNAKLESVLLLRFQQARDQTVHLVTWGSIDEQTLEASIDGRVVLPQTSLEGAQRRRDLEFTVPKDVLTGDPIKEVVFRFRDVADYGGGVAFATLAIDPSLLEP